MKKDLVQLLNPITDCYVKIDRGKIISHKQTKGPYKGIRIAHDSEPHNLDMKT